MAGSLTFLDTRELDELLISDKGSRLVLTPPPPHQNCPLVGRFHLTLIVCCVARHIYTEERLAFITSRELPLISYGVIFYGISPNSTLG